MTQEMSVDILGREGGEQIDPGKLTMQQSDGHVRRDKGRDGQQGERGKEEEKNQD